jgi:hypothetical protein
VVAAWSVDRLGRSLIDLLDFLRERSSREDDGHEYRVQMFNYLI